MSTKQIFVMLILIVGFLIGACSSTPEIVEVAGGDEPLNLNGLIEVLQDSGAAVELGDQIDQPFFTNSAQILRINNIDVQVFEFPDVASRETATATISPDGTAIGTSMVSWMDTPHFWSKGQVIVLYVGSDSTTIALLDSLLN